MKNKVASAPIAAELFAANAKRIRAQIAAIGFRQLLGAELDDLEPGSCTVSVARRPELLHAAGIRIVLSTVPFVCGLHFIAITERPLPQATNA